LDIFILDKGILVEIFNEDKALVKTQTDPEFPPGLEYGIIPVSISLQCSKMLIVTKPF